MTNADLLKMRIDESGLKLQFIADKLGISRAALYMKLENKSDFRQGEIRTLCELLKIVTAEEKDQIFLS